MTAPGLKNGSPTLWIPSACAVLKSFTLLTVVRVRNPNRVQGAAVHVFAPRFPRGPHRATLLWNRSLQPHRPLLQLRAAAAIAAPAQAAKLKGIVLTNLLTIISPNPVRSTAACTAAAFHSARQRGYSTRDGHLVHWARYSDHCNCDCFSSCRRFLFYYVDGRQQHQQSGRHS